MKAKSTFLIFFLCLFSFLFTGCKANTEPVSEDGFFFDTIINITLYDGTDFSKDHTAAVMNDCFALCTKYENMLSRTREGSDIWKLNHAEGSPVEVSSETADLLSTALSYCKKTNGALDITIAPISSLWNFSSESQGEVHTVPTDDNLKELLTHVNYKEIELDGNTVTLKDPKAAIDLGCIAKGYIADQIKTLLKEEGMTSALINLGGNVLTLGNKPDGSAFKIGIKKPFSKTNESFTTLEVTDSSLVSSGTYERYFTVGDTFYHHILNAHTGKPENNGLLSVTILSKDSTSGDALSTSCFLLGQEKGMELIESLPDTEAIFLTEDYVAHPSSGLQ